jgi:hypothetical protein
MNTTKWDGTSFTDRGNILDLYSAGGWFESRPGHRTILTKFFPGFSQALKINTGIEPEL